MNPSTFRQSRRSRRGIIFVTAMWIILVLGAMVLIFSRSMRVEVAASANRLAGQQASTIELGAEQYVLSAVDSCNGDAQVVLNTPAEQIQLGDGYFWILQPNYDDDNTSAFGLTDETSKLNLNVATSDALAQLPGMTQDVADSIVDWRDADSKVSGQGAESDYYQLQPRPYTAKNSPFESVEELYLVKNVTDTLLWGYDLDHNGIIDATEEGAGGLATAFNSANDAGRGIFPFITAWGKEPNTDVNGKKRVNINKSIAGYTPTTSPLQRVFTAAGISKARATEILNRAAIFRNRPFVNLFDFAFRTGMKSAELAKVSDRLTTSDATTLTGLVNVNTASQQVLMCLGLAQEDAASIVAQRASRVGTAGSGSGTGSGSGAGAGLGGATPGSGANSAAGSSTDYTWVMDALSPLKAAKIGALITGRSFFYSADIVAVSGEGRAYKRVRIVVDARSSPPMILYRKDMTYLGWPLLPDILTALKSGQPLPGVTNSGTGGMNGLPQ